MTGKEGPETAKEKWDGGFVEPLIFMKRCFRSARLSG
jgi:hypothetical protein